MNACLVKVNSKHKADENVSTASKPINTRSENAGDR